MDTNSILVAVVVAVVVVGWFALGVRTIQQYQRGVIFRFGSFAGARSPGLNFIIPIVDRLVRVDMRVMTIVVAPQEVITRDNVTVQVDAVVYFQVVDPERAIIRVADFVNATSQLAQTTLRSVLGQSELDELLAHRDEINRRLREIIDEQTEEPWGVRVVLVEVKDAQLPEGMQRAMARQAEAEREKRAKIIHAEGEFQASQQLTAAARVLGEEPAALQLRYLQTLVEMAGEGNSTIIPIPIDIINNLSQLVPRLRDGGSQKGADS